MKLPSYNTAKGVAVLTAVGLVGFIVWKIYRTGQGAVETVTNTIAGIGDSVSTTWHEIAGRAAGAYYSVAPGEVGPLGGGSRQELQRMDTVDQTPTGPYMYPADSESPFMHGASLDSRYGGPNAPERMALGTDGMDYDIVTPQDYSPDAMGLA